MLFSDIHSESLSSLPVERKPHKFSNLLEIALKTQLSGFLDTRNFIEIRL